MDKPDFLGKRSFSRILDDGLKQILVGYKMARTDIAPAEDCQIVTRGSGNKMEIIGWISSSRFSPTLNESIGLCWLLQESGNQNGTSFTIKVNEKLETANGFHGTFYDPEGTRQKM